MSTEVRYRKGTPWAITRSIIEKNTFEGVASYMNHLLRNLHAAAASAASASPQLHPAALPTAPSDAPASPPEAIECVLLDR